MSFIDLESVKLRADLLAICSRDTQLKKHANTAGGEWSGPCPFCGGKDRFYVQPYAKPFPRWACRQCTPGGDSVIGYIARRDNLDPEKKEDLAEICRRAAGGDLPTTSGHRPGPAPQPAYSAPPEDWQAAARAAIVECEAALWRPKCKSVLDYLHRRGLQDETIRRFGLGYNTTGKPDQYGREIAGIYIPRGITIPCIVAGQVWYLKIRLMPGVPCKCQKCNRVIPGPGECPSCKESNKYRGVKGNRTAAIYNADSLTRASMAVFCEGEFDCMLASQEFGDIIPAVTLGSSTNRPDLAIWGAYLLPLRLIMAAYDNDQAGEVGAVSLADISNRVRLAPLPEGVKDITDYHLAGGDLLTWITDYQAFYCDPFFMEVA